MSNCGQSNHFAAVKAHVLHLMLNMIVHLGEFNFQNFLFISFIAFFDIKW